MTNPSSQRFAEDAVDAYIGASFRHEYSYDCAANPDSLSDAELARRLDAAHAQMMDALAALSDDDVADILGRIQQRDHDGSRFAVVSVEDVRRHRAQVSAGVAEDAPPRPRTERIVSPQPRLKEPSGFR